VKKILQSKIIKFLKGDVCMKKTLAFVIAGAMVLSTASLAFAKPNIAHKSKHYKTTYTAQTNVSKNAVANNEYQTFKGKFTVRGKKIGFDAAPVIKKDRTLVPVRAIAESLGAVVNFDPTTNTVTITKDSKTIQIVLGQTKVYVNGQEVTMDVPAANISNRTFVPIRFIAQILGETVNYDNNGDISITDNSTANNSGTSTDNNTVTSNVYGSSTSTVANSVYGQ
jgi:hypothetical protein